MCAAAARLADVFRCCVTSQPAPLPVHRTPAGDAACTTSLCADTVDGRDVAAPATTASSTTPLTMRCPRYPAGGCRCHPACQYITFKMDDPSLPVPVCCCERCDGGWFPPEVSLRVCSCLLACDVDHVTTGKTLCDSVRRHCAWTGDVMYLDAAEKAEMSLMSRDFKGVDLLVCFPLSVCTP